MRIRVLGLGNDLLADDAFGLVAARLLEAQLPQGVEVMYSAAAGLSLLDALEGATHLLVLDTWPRDGAPGTVSRVEIASERAPGASAGFDRPGEADLTEGCLLAPPGSSLHYVGLMDALALGRALGMLVPSRLAAVTVEPADCRTLGGAMTDAVRAALPEALRVARGVVEAWRAS